MNTTSPLHRWVLIVFLLFMIFAGAYFAKPFLVPLAIAAILSMLFLPVSKKLESAGLHRAIAAIVCILMLLAAFAGLFTLIGWQVANLAEEKDKMKQQFKQKIENVKQFIDEKLGIPPEQQQQAIKDQTSGGSGGMSKTGVAILKTFFTVIVDTILVLVYIFFFLFSRSHLKKAILKMAPESKRAKTEKVIGDTTNVAQKYLSGLAIMIVCLWIMYGIGFSIAGVKNAIFFGILCGLLEIIPFIGNITGTTITVLMAVTQGGGTGVILGILITYAIVQFIQGNLIEPLVVGAEVNVNALATILVLVIGEALWGIPGLILAIPILGIIKVICDNVEGLQPIGFLIGQEKKERSSKWADKARKLVKK